MGKLGPCRCGTGRWPPVETDRINPAVGYSDVVRLGAKVTKGNPLAVVHAGAPIKADAAERAPAAIRLAAQTNAAATLIHDRWLMASNACAKGPRVSWCMDSVGIGGAPDAGSFFNGDFLIRAQHLGHIRAACADGRAEEGRSGPLTIQPLQRLGMFHAEALAHGYL